MDLRTLRCMTNVSPTVQAHQHSPTLTLLEELGYLAEFGQEDREYLKKGHFKDT